MDLSVWNPARRLPLVKCGIAWAISREIQVERALRVANASVRRFSRAALSKKRAIKVLQIPIRQRDDHRNQKAQSGEPAAPPP